MEVGTRSPAWARLGLRAVRSGGGRAVVEMDSSADMGNLHEHVHSGFVGGLADAAMALAVDSALPPGAGRDTFDLKMSFVEAAEVGATLRATAAVVHLGRRTALAECRVAAGGALVASATATFRIGRAEAADAD